MPRVPPVRADFTPADALTQLALTVCCLVSGAALVLTITLQRPLWATLMATAIVVCTSAAGIWHRAAPRARAILLRRLQVGLLAGVIATSAYDGSRWLLVWIFTLRVSPFGALPFFGASLLGAAASRQSAWVAGFVYHVLNGSLFGAAYAVLLGHRAWWAAVLWSLGLELAMLTFYPLWLDLGAVMGEFTVMSVTGHLAYGTTLGLLCQRRFTQSS